MDKDGTALDELREAIALAPRGALVAETDDRRSAS